MWNIKSINPICQKRKLTEDQTKLITNIQNIKKRIDNQTPWQPSHSLSKWSNKYTHENEEKIMYQNNVLLNKMMDIQKNILPQTNSYKQFPNVQPIVNPPSMIDSQRKREKFQIMQENQRFLKRLQSANSMYGRKFWSLDDEKHQKYRENILKKTSIIIIQIQQLKEIDEDYTELVKRNLQSQKGSRSQMKSQFAFRQNARVEEKLQEGDEEIL